MDAKEYFRERERMCKSQNPNDECVGCPLEFFDECSGIESVDIVEKWSKEHPRKTRQDAFLKLFPKARVSDEGLIVINPCAIEHDLSVKCMGSGMSCRECRKKYWLGEADEDFLKNRKDKEK